MIFTASPRSVNLSEGKKTSQQAIDDAPSYIISFGAERADPTILAQLTPFILRFEGENRCSLLTSIQGRRVF